MISKRQENAEPAEMKRLPFRVISDTFTFSSYPNKSSSKPRSFPGEFSFLSLHFLGLCFLLVLPFNHLYVFLGSSHRVDGILLTRRETQNPNVATGLSTPYAVSLELARIYFDELRRFRRGKKTGGVEGMWNERGGKFWGRGEKERKGKVVVWSHT